MLEIILQIIGSVLSAVKFRNRKTKNLVFIMFTSVLVLALAGVLTTAAVEFWMTAHVVAAVVLGVLALVILLLGVLLVIRGCKTDWKGYY